MPLSFTGNSVTTERFEMILKAFDRDKRVVVVTSHEATDDYGLPAVQSKASDKYDAGQLDAEGRVRVFTADFAPPT